VTNTTGPAAERLTAAARAWLETLTDDGRSRAVFRFDDAERFAWDYVPGTRLGLAAGEMTPEQRLTAAAIVEAALSERGAREVRGVMDLEPILGELERRAGRGNWQRRDPGLYWHAIFGTPGMDEPWSWRIGGHHVAIHVTVARGRVIGTTPSFLGANPQTVPDGPSAGHRTLDGEERLARALLASLTQEQRRHAIVDRDAPADILSGSGRRAELRDVPTGIRYNALDAGQRMALEALIRYYVGRSQPAVADAEWSRIRDASLDAITFAWAGPDEPGHGHYYAVHGPRLLIEYDNTQDRANHIHSVWRDPTNDWGEDLLAAHYRAAHRSG
jgi:hypothetical protein